ncbi:hypothetical protein [Desulforamulus ruminis]|uniref:Uncharacterized protein n=1 Tax=Desulforamulus ruminis (strain ATCC 23193 / DSM 2154 / NCIMB 8452 / DL) TaxID=696281 RepID=F6DSV8_DESRL|nr:hypothetical protein [Desulforamulus ruminis]AEG59952.1 hypothetical protein Desru_1688 [Desulforamulus ruminis DSM 2154]
MSSSKETEFNNLPHWFQRIIPLISVILSALAFSYVVYRYNQASLELVHWVRIIIFALIGIVSLFSAVLYAFNKELSWKWVIGGLSLIPILLALQLILLFMNIFKVAIGSILEGRLPETVRMFIENYPSKFDIIILAVLFMAGILWVIDKLRTKEK